MHIEIITPDRTIYSGEADKISLPTPDGEITILPHHIPLISIVTPGTVEIRKNREEYLFAVSRGVIEVDGQTVRLLVDSADRAQELTEEAVLRAKEAAQKLMTEKRHDTEGFAEATAMLERELARLKVVRRHRSRRL
ncbi:ATP synthase F1 subunit epsilon [Candidatus Peregrinibacteria bacterium]|nr:ATP synthase F1 subunit epsilon [Candidatus Peregrinibacteria bacterium]